MSKLQNLNKKTTSVLKILFTSMPLVLVLMFFYAFACGVATFIESAQSTPIAKASVYDTWWFNVLHLWLGLCLIGTFSTSKSWQRKKYASLLLHFSFVVIIFSAGITRFFGFEGSMPIRENSSSNKFYSLEPYLMVVGLDKNSAFPKSASFKYSGLKNESFAVKFDDLIVNLKVIDSEMLQNEFSEAKTPKITLQVSIQGEQNYQTTAELVQSMLGDFPMDQTTIYQDEERIISLVWGSKMIKLPFSIYLDDFVLDKYPGSEMPSSYSSFVKVLDDSGEMVQEAHIFMNNVLDYGGYRFFQSSYFPDESGTILSVNNDPGKIPTYIGYTLLVLGCIWLLFDKNGRFAKLSNILRQNSISTAFVAFFVVFNFQNLNSSDFELSNTQNSEISESSTKNGLDSKNLDSGNSQEFEHMQIHIPNEEEIQALIKKLKENSKDFAQDFSGLLVQDFKGRVKPIDTMATEYMHKITGKDNFLGLSSMQLLLGILMYPEYFRSIKMVQTKSPKLREILGLDPKEKYIAPADAYMLDSESNEFIYVLGNHLKQANMKPLKERDVFDKDVIAVNERLYLLGLITTAEALKILPSTQGDGSWHSILSAKELQNVDWKADGRYKMNLYLLQALAPSFVVGVFANNWKEAYEMLEVLKKYQEKYAITQIDKSKIDAEIFLNKSQIFKRLMYPYILLGLGLFVFAFVSIIRAKPLKKYVVITFMVLIGLCFITQTLGLALRWYVGEHAPWSNAYEIMLYIAWASILAGLLFARRSSLALSAASFLAGMCLFVAHLGNMDPEIGNLVPVLKSYWLNIHVSVISASYGFLGLCFVLGTFTLILFLMRDVKNSSKPHIDKAILSVSAINEMSMILGLFMLTIGNFLGGVWANESWGRYWGWDPKETWALITIGVYSIVLHLRLAGVKNLTFTFAAASVVAFASVVMTYFGVNFFLVGMHSYASGDAQKVPEYVYVIVLVLSALIIASSFKAGNMQDIDELIKKPK